MLHAVVEVDFDIPVGEVVNLFLVFLEFRRLILKLFLTRGQLDALGRGGVVDGTGELRKLGAVTLLLFVNIVGAKAG